MQILFLTFYYPPDLCACSFRAQPIVEGLLRKSGNLHVDVVTTMPNRYKTHRETALAVEKTTNLTINRVALPIHQSGMIDQSRAFSTYARQVKKITRVGKWDLVLATSSRLMTASLGASVARRLKAPLYLDIRDLFADTIKDVLGKYAATFFLPVLRMIERRTFSSAAKINVVSEGFLPYISRFAPNTPIACHTHGIDTEFLDFDFVSPAKKTERLNTIVYAGNIGEGQGFHKIIPDVAKKLKEVAEFRIIGDGGLRQKLEHAIKDNAITNVELIPALPRIKILEHYRDADFLLCHLNDHPAFRKVLPSKLFEQAATGKRMLAGISGYAEAFVNQNIPGCAVFRPCDADAFLDSYRKLAATPGVVDRAAFREKFSRENVISCLIDDILSTIR